MLLLLEDDLLFESRIRGVLELHHVPVTAVGTASEAIRHLGLATIERVLINMRLANEELLEALTHFTGPVAFYGSHVEGERFQWVRSFGFHEVWPHSRLFSRLGSWVGWDRV